MSEGTRDGFEELKAPSRKNPAREAMGALPGKGPGLAGGREEDCSKQNSFLSTKRMSEHSQRDEPFEGFVPIIKRVAEPEQAPECGLHQHKRLKYFDISSPHLRLCSKCVLELVVDRNFNSSMTKEDFLNNLSLLSSDLSRIQDKIGRDMDDLEKTHRFQRTFLDNLFSQLALMVDEVRLKYSTRVDKTFQSIREIFSEKVAKLSKFEKEMKELEKDVRLNYSNIIKLMDLEPFYEIIYRYNKKLNTIKSVFNEFKGKPDEIPEDAIRVKNMKSQLGFVAGFGRKLENFFSCDDSCDSNNSSQFADLDAHLADPSPRRDFQLLPALLVAPAPRKPPCGSRATQTDPAAESEGLRKKHAQLATASAAKDDLKAQAEMLIKSVDTLICHGESTALSLAKAALQSPPPQLAAEARQAKSITKGEISKRIQAHFNSAAHVGKPKNRSSSNTQLKTGPHSLAQNSPILLDKKQSEAGLARELDFDDIGRELGYRQRDFRAKNPREKSNPVPASPQVYFTTNVIVSQPAGHPGSRHKLNKLSSAQQSSGTLASAGKEKEPKDSKEPKDTKQLQTGPLSVSKTERLLQLYRKNKTGSAALAN